MNAYCPAKIVVTESEKCVNVRVFSTHIGHNDDLRACHLSHSEKQNIASKLSSGVPLERILKDIRDSFRGEFQKVHLTTKQDLHNIIEKYNIECKKTSSDFLNTEALIDELGDTVLFYKNQTSMCEKYDQLCKNDFCLILMNEYQKNLLTRYGDKIITIDSTHGLNPYDFQLTTVMIIDNLNQGFPCVFMFSNKTDKNIMEVLFNEIKLQVGQLKPRVFMSDMANSFYNAFLNIFGEVPFRLYCNWHVEKGWKENLSKVKGKEKKVFGKYTLKY